MIAACLALTLIVSPYMEPVVIVPVRVCINKAWHNDEPMPMEPRSRCELLANRAIQFLQHEGYLPGSHDVIAYRVDECTMEASLR